MPRVGINLTWLVPGVVGGSEEYSVRLLQGMAELAPDDLLVRIYGRSDLFARYPDLARRFDAIIMPKASSKPARIMAEQTWLARVSGQDRLMHHMGGVVPLRRSQASIVTIHDIQPIDMPENFGWVKRYWLNRMIPYSSRVAAVVVCPSRFTADRLVERLGIPSEKIRVVPHGHDPVDRVESAGVMGERLGSRRFVLYPAIAYAHKRHGDVVAAVAALPKSCDDLQVVFTGRPGPETGNLRAQAAALGLGRRVHFTGRLPEAELDWLYRNAQAMVFPSAYEGFGNPAVEAMSRGCPVIVSDAGALPEVVGSAGLVIPVGDVTALTVAIGDTVGDNERARCLRASGVQRARGFATSIASKTLLAVYRDALQQPPPP